MRVHHVPPLRESLGDLAFLALGIVMLLSGVTLAWFADSRAGGLGAMAIGMSFLLTTELRQTRRKLNFLIEAYAREHPEAVVDTRHAKP